MTKTRWDYSKELSNYHFDNSINEDANPHFKIIGRVKGDLLGFYKRSLEKFNPEPNGFLNRLDVQLDWKDIPYTIDYDRAELEYLQLDPNHVFFHNLRYDKTDMAIIKILMSFKFKDNDLSGASFHIQRPGGVFPYHIDEIPGVKKNDPNSFLDKDPKWAARFEIQLYDWQPGHVWAVGNTYWKQWKAGDIAWHDWRNTPHGTANIGRSDRTTLQITGLCTEETLAIIANGNHSVTV
jgi:hypothetical protein